MITCIRCKLKYDNDATHSCFIRDDGLLVSTTTYEDDLFIGSSNKRDNQRDDEGQQIQSGFNDSEGKEDL